MARFLFTMLPADDLGLPTRLVPIARALADRGHQVAVFNPSPAPAKLISDAGLTNLPLPPRPMPVPPADLAQASAVWDVDQMLASFLLDEDYLRAATVFFAQAMCRALPWRSAVTSWCIMAVTARS
ncbi:MAG: glycosyltransferase [Candidatus Acidiferrum sp.]